MNQGRKDLYKEMKEYMNMRPKKKGKKKVNEEIRDIMKKRKKNERKINGKE